MKKTIYTVILLSFLTTAMYSQTQGTDDIYYKSPDVTMTDINGDSHNLYDLLDEGKFVLIDLYTTWCQPCRENAPFVESWYEEHGPAGDNTVEMWNIEADATGTDLQDVLDWITEFAVTCPAFEDNSSLFWSLDQFPINGYPTYFLVCPDRYYGRVIGQKEDLIAELNSFISDCPALGTYSDDANLLVYNAAENVQCSNHSPVVRIENRGSENLESLIINTYVNDNLDNAFEWSGSLSQYEVTKVTLPQLTGTYAVGDNDIKVELALPNGLPDEDDSNNANSGQYTLIDGVTPAVNAGFGYGAESYRFEIVNSTDEVIFTHEFAASSSYGTENLDLCLNNNECYTLKIYDKIAGSGEGFVFDQEYLEIRYNDEQLLFFDKSNYAEQNASFNFCVGMTSSTNQIEGDEISIFPNPSSGTIQIIDEIGGGSKVEIFTAVGKKISELNLSDGTGQAMIESPGLYFIKFTRANDLSTVTKKIMIGR